MNQVAEIKKWFELSFPEVGPSHRAVQYGCHLEEVAEGMDAVGDFDESGEISKLAEMYKRKNEAYVAGLEIMNVSERTGLLDSLADQIVTAIGVAHMFGFDIEGALKEVNRSNFSKFVDGKPVFNEQGKIAKGANYTPPDLTPYLGK